MNKRDVTTKLAATEASLKRWQTRLKRAAKMVHDLDRRRRRYQLALLSEGQPVVAKVTVKNGKVTKVDQVAELNRAEREDDGHNAGPAIETDHVSEADLPAFLDRRNAVVAEEMTKARKAAEAEARKAMPLTGRAALDALKKPKRVKSDDEVRKYRTSRKLREERA